MPTATTTALRTERPSRLPVRRLGQLRRLVDQALADALGGERAWPAPLREAMRYAALAGGKRFRPLLCLGGCEAVGGLVRHALPVAAALELIHAYSLVHDDLPAMDNAALRRGRPSCHRRFGEATAILVGDALLTRAFEHLGGSRIPNALQIVSTIGEACGPAGLIGGQLLDLRGGSNGRRAGMRALEAVAGRKTAALITASVVAGGLAGGGSGPALERLRRFGRTLGVAFQLTDDLLDHDGAVRLMSPHRVRERARRLVRQAREAIAPFGSKAAILLELAGWLARRESA